jgi:hypothetical protein
MTSAFRFCIRENNEILIATERDISRVRRELHVIEWPLSRAAPKHFDAPYFPDATIVETNALAVFLFRHIHSA